MKKLSLFFFWMFILSTGLFFFASQSKADRIEKMNDVPVRNDFPIGPSQISIEASAGDVIKKEIQIDNRAGEKRDFHVEIEDFEGSNTNPDQTVLLQGDKIGRYGGKEWFSIEKKDFSIEHGDRQYLDVTIKIPEDADAGDHYTSVLVSMIPKDTETKEGTNVRITSRAGILFFIKIKGETNRSGELKTFDVSKKTYWNLPGEKNKKDEFSNPVKMKTTFENTGSVRLRPSGQIEIKNMLGKISGIVSIEEYNVLRDSVRQMEYSWDASDFKLGKYTATLKLNRDYDSLSDTKEVSFWIIPWKQILIGFCLMVISLLAIYFIRKNVHIKLGKK